MWESNPTIAIISLAIPLAAVLDEYMLSMDCNIEKCNLRVRMQRDALMSRGETNLFTAYKAMEDKVFHDYMHDWSAGSVSRRTI